MLPRSQRISVHLFKDTIQKGEVFHSPFFIVRCVKNSTSSHFAVSVSKKVAKTAVLRNKIRRRMYSIVEKLIPTLISKRNTVIMMKSCSDKASIEVLKKELEKTFVKCGLLK